MGDFTQNFTSVQQNFHFSAYVKLTWMFTEGSSNLTVQQQLLGFIFQPTPPLVFGPSSYYINDATIPVSLRQTLESLFFPYSFSHTHPPLI